MVREFKLPDVGEGVAEGELLEWRVEPGDTVSEDQVVAEVETDKAVVDVPSPVDGTVRELLAEPGEMVPVGTVIITFDVEQSSADSRAAQPRDSGEKPRASEGGEQDATAETETEAASDDSAAVGGSERAVADESGEAAAETADSSVNGQGGRVFAAPSARRLARELGVDIAAVDGSGPGGRVTEADVRTAAEGSDGSGGGDESSGDGKQLKSAISRIDDGDSGQPGATAGSAQAVEAAGRDRTLAAPATRKVAEEVGVDIDDVPTDEMRDGKPFVDEGAVREYAEAQKQAQAADAEALAASEGAGEAEAGPEARAGGSTGGAGTADTGVEAGAGERREPYRGVRKTIGQAMERSKFTAPHVTHHDKVDATALVDLREKLKARAEERGVKLTYMPFVMKAVSAALSDHPIINTQLDEENDEIVFKDDHNVGVATATDAGLMVPVVKDVDDKGLLQLASEANELVSKARERSIAREEMQDGTFTITNFGTIGGEYATPIINYPETAILGLGAIEKRPMVVEREARSASERASDARATSGSPRSERGAERPVSGETASHEVVARDVLTLSLSIDHRVIDGADAGRFVNTLMEYLEDPSLLLLE
ncbi:branched-chain alpha-keto acid dehydrogenase subunit E2 [Halobacteriales archaeon QS_9_67_15]|nr:MAG: branched-chain alpha-keto acid dehydrogenase subunit E2 [Halobacteriales archaeon QS_9_67_15]